MTIGGKLYGCEKFTASWMCQGGELNQGYKCFFGVVFTVTIAYDLVCFVTCLGQPLEKIKEILAAGTKSEKKEEKQEDKKME